MTKFTLSAVVLCICVVGVCQGWYWKLSTPFQPNGCSFVFSRPEIKRCYPCSPFRTKRVTLVVQNILREPTFEQSVTLRCTRSRTLFYMMQEAADIDTAFRFTVSYDHANHPGFFVNAFNGLYSQWQVDRTWWEILDGDLKHTPVGASSYEPYNGETVMFNFTQGFGH